MGDQSMSTKTLAVLTDTDGHLYRLTKWSSTGSRLPSSNPQRPAKLEERCKGNGWVLLESWPSCDGKPHSATLKDDREVLKEALKRLKFSLDVTVYEIIYDDYDDRVLDNVAGIFVTEVADADLEILGDGPEEDINYR